MLKSFIVRNAAGFVWEVSGDELREEGGKHLSPCF